MSEDLRAELTNLVGPATWHNLLPHAARDNLVVVNAGLDLVEVGLALTADNVTAVQRWISEALISKPTAEQLQHWDRDRSRQFQALIVQPYVLIQEPDPT
ncbi:MAG: DUF2288 domain-containing protein [Cyanobacteria bacterium]|nr:DUF2288 domain-containing protein [Cyanobacteriota bacterium]MEB3268722.1 DUF2288 domain-containing protein [Leptolyngbya sp.]